MQPWAFLYHVGKIFDREGNPVVDNKSLRTITYTKVKGVKQEEILKSARQLADIIEILRRYR